MAAKVDMEKLIDLGLNYKIQELEVAGTVRSTGEVPYVKVDFLKKEYTYQSPTILLQKQLEGKLGNKEHRYRLVTNVSRTVIKDFIELLREKGFKENLNKE